MPDESSDAREDRPTPLPEDLGDATSERDPASQLPDEGVRSEAGTGPADDSGSDPGAPAARGPVTWRELGRDFARPGRGQIILAAILLVVGMALVMQFRSNTAAAPYESLRRSDLVQLLDNLNQESQRLSTEISEQDELKRQLQSGAGQEDAARKEAEQRLETLQILAGTAPATGEGIVLVIHDPQGKMTADILLNAIEELRDAGAEVIEINNSIRVVASTWITAGSDGILVDGKLVRTPITIEAIGDPHSLEEGARFRGGLVSEVEGQRVNGSVSITQSNKIAITALHAAPTNQYARPA